MNTIIEKIRAKVERLIKECDGSVSQYGFGKESACNRILNFLDTLQEQPVKDFPITDEEMKQFLATHPKVELPERYKTPDWMFEKSEKPSEGLEEEIERYLSTEWKLDEDLDKDDYIYGCTLEDLKILARHFAKWQKEQMMKEAVEIWMLDGSMYEPEFIKKKVIVIKEDKQ